MKMKFLVLCVLSTFTMNSAFGDTDNIPRQNDMPLPMGVKKGEIKNKQQNNDEKNAPVIIKKRGEVKSAIVGGMAGDYARAYKQACGKEISGQELSKRTGPGSTNEDFKDLDRAFKAKDSGAYESALKRIGNNC